MVCSHLIYCSQINNLIKIMIDLFIDAYSEEGVFCDSPKELLLGNFIHLSIDDNVNCHGLLTLSKFQECSLIDFTLYAIEWKPMALARFFFICLYILLDIVRLFTQLTYAVRGSM